MTMKRKIEASKRKAKKPKKNNELSGPVLRDSGDYLSDTPFLRAMGFSVSQHDQLGMIPPPPFLSVSP